MDEIASEIGVSKTVLYRYFADKNDLTNATMMRYVETILAPRIYAAIGAGVDEYELTRAAITAYVETVASDPEVYLYVMANSAGGNRAVIADSERMIAEVLSTVLGERLRQMEMDSGGSMPWAYAIVGGVQLATHWWISQQVDVGRGPDRLPADDGVGRARGDHPRRRVPREVQGAASRTADSADVVRAGRISTSSTTSTSTVTTTSHVTTAPVG